MVPKGTILCWGSWAAVHAPHHVTSLCCLSRCISHSGNSSQQPAGPTMAAFLSLLRYSIKHSDDVPLERWVGQLRWVRLAAATTPGGSHGCHGGIHERGLEEGRMAVEPNTVHVGRHLLQVAVQRGEGEVALALPPVYEGSITGEGWLWRGGKAASGPMVACMLPALGLDHHRKTMFMQDRVRGIQRVRPTPLTPGGLRTSLCMPTANRRLRISPYFGDSNQIFYSSGHFLPLQARYIKWHPRRSTRLHQAQRARRISQVRLPFHPIRPHPRRHTTDSCCYL